MTMGSCNLSGAKVFEMNVTLTVGGSGAGPFAMRRSNCAPPVSFDRVGEPVMLAQNTRRIDMSFTD